MTPGFGGKRRLRSPEQREAQRAASDRRARSDQACQAAAEEATRRSATQRATQPAAAAAQRQRPITAPVAAALRPVASKHQYATHMVDAELRHARARIAELQAELERFRAVALDVQRRVEGAVGRRAA